MVDNALIYLFGYPGVGKNTIAREIEQSSNLIAVQNHLISNAFRHVAAKQAKPYAEIEEHVKHYTMKAWLNFLDFIDVTAPEQGLVFTSVLYDDPDRIEYYEFVRDWAAQHNRAFYPVRLTCARDELIKRLTSASRNAEFKLTDASVLENILATNDLLTPRDKNFLDLDITQLSAADAAKTILQHCA